MFTIHLADDLGGIDDISEIKQVIMKNMFFNLCICLILYLNRLVQYRVDQFMHSLGNRTHDHSIARATRIFTDSKEIRYGCIHCYILNQEGFVAFQRLHKLLHLDERL